jgi:predicted ArsR family transcriptional regulator
MQKLNVEEVVSFLKSAPATVGEVAAKFAATKQTANRVLANLRKAGTVAVVSSRSKGEHVRGRPEFIYGVLAPGVVVEVPVARVEVIDVPVAVAPVETPVEETKAFSFDDTDRP